MVVPAEQDVRERGQMLVEGGPPGAKMWCFLQPTAPNSLVTDYAMNGYITYVPPPGGWITCHRSQQASIGRFLSVVACGEVRCVRNLGFCVTVKWWERHKLRALRDTRLWREECFWMAGFDMFAFQACLDKDITGCKEPSPPNEARGKRAMTLHTDIPVVKAIVVATLLPKHRGVAGK